MVSGFFKGSAAPSTAGPSEGLIPSCGACGLYRTCETPKVSVSGGGKRGIMLVDLAPSARGRGYSETYFGGDYARHIRSVLEECDVDMDFDCWHVGALACSPSKAVNSEHVVYCRPKVHAAIKELNPSVIIPFGYLPTVACVKGAAPDIGSPDLWPGWVIPDQRYNAWICPTWHPSFIYGSETKMVKNGPHKEMSVLSKLFKSHVTTAVGKTSRPWRKVPEWSKSVEIIKDDDEAARAIRFALSDVGDGAMAFDYETNMLKPEPDEAEIFCCSLAWGNNAPRRVIAFPWGPSARAAMAEVLRSPAPKIAANLKFEDRWTRKEFGFRVRGWAWDTMVNAHLIDNRPGITGLKFQAYAELGQPDYDSAVAPYLAGPSSMEKNNIHRAGLDKVLLYCGMDSLLEFVLAVRQAGKMSYTLPWRVK